MRSPDWGPYERAEGPARREGEGSSRVGAEGATRTAGEGDPAKEIRPTDNIGGFVAGRTTRLGR